ncbi:unnamed protein product, partial [Hapterophycus canaliculatus]
EERGENVWRPLKDNSEVAVPVTKPGSVPLPSRRTGGGGGATSAVGMPAGGSSTLSFSFATSASEAEAAVNAHIGASVPSGADATTTAKQPTVDPDILGSRPSGLPVGSSAEKGTRSSEADTSDVAAEGAAVAAPSDTSGAKARIGWDPSRLGTARNGSVNIHGTAGASSDATCSAKAKSVSKFSAAPSASLTSNPSSRLVGPTAAGQPVAEGGGGGDTALASPQQRVKACHEVGGRVDWSLSGTSGLASEKFATTAFPASVTHGLLFSPPSLGEEGGAGDALPREPLLQQQQQQQQRQQRIGWDPARLATAKANVEGWPTTSDPGAVNPSAVDISSVSQEERQETQETRVRPPPTSARKVGWNASRIGKPAVRAPVERNTNSAMPGAVEAAPAEAISDQVKPKIGWNPSRVGNPAIPAPTKMEKDAGIPSAAAVASAVTAAVAVAGRTAAGCGAVDDIRVSGQGRSDRRVEVPLQLRAVLIYASTQRGIDLRKWFDVGDGGGGGKGEDEEDEIGQEAPNSEPIPLTMVQFELILAGLAEGLKAGLSEEERDEIDAAVAPGVVAVAAGLATLPAVEEQTTRTNQSSNRDLVDVGRLLDLCGIPASAPTSEQLVRQIETAREGAAPLAVPPEKGSGSEDSEDYGYLSEEGIDDGALTAALTPEGEDRGRKGEHNLGRHGGVTSGGGGRDEREAAAAADEMALRRISHQADLYGRLMVCLGLKQPVGCPRQGAYADWEAFLRVSSISLEAFRAALGQVGLRLSRTRAMALATHACGPLSAATHVTATAIPEARVGRRGGHEKVRSKAATAAGHKSLGRSRSVGPSHNGGGGGAIRYSQSSNAESARCLSHTAGGRRGLRRGGQRKSASNSLQGRQHQRRLPEKASRQKQKQQKQQTDDPPSGGSGGEASNGSSSVSLSRDDLHLRSRSHRQSLPTQTLAHPPLRRKPRRRLNLPAWELRRYLLRLRCEPKSREARCDQQQRRRKRHLVLSGQKEQQRQWSDGDEDECGWSGKWMFETEGAAGGAAEVGKTSANLSVFAAWGKRVREERAERERERRREFQRALAGRPHSLTIDQLLECVGRFEIMPPQILAREVHAMGEAFSESVEGARRAREIARRWSQASPASRNACGPDDAEQEAWEHAQTLSGAQRRSKACAIVAGKKEEELAESEEKSAAVSRSLFLAYARNAHGGGAGEGAVSLQQWLEDRQAAMKKARELEAARDRAKALSKADTEGRKALVSELKDELLRLVGSTKKTQKVDNAPGMEVLRSSREGLDINRRLKRLDTAAAEEEAEGERARKEQHRPRQLARSPPAPPLLSKRAFNAEMGDVLFSLTADGATAARARELAGVPFIEADLRKRWCVGASAPRRESGATTRRPRSVMCGREAGVPSAMELFGLEEALLVGRGKKDAEQKRELALQK